MEWQQSIVDSGTRSGGKVEPVEPPPPTPPSAATLSNTCTEHAAAKGSDARTALSAPNSTAALPTKKLSVGRESRSLGILLLFHRLTKPFASSFGSSHTSARIIAAHQSTRIGRAEHIALRPSSKPRTAPALPSWHHIVPARFGVDTILDPNAQLAVSPSRLFADSQSHRLARLYTVPCIGSLGLVYSRVAQLPLIPLVPQRASASLPVDAYRFDAVPHAFLGIPVSSLSKRLPRGPNQGFAPTP
ncbi:hypothetical protein PaG_03181 [Moesziomyces aphidis]|uniref:Uncharacterized protein n=1 Tax=Moesziomyces aphidis TaxID=84754 RepID=W3VP36_MOEAP|nr:hypothetical protein PaG_03181 [Moesziomyces aphidis]